MNGPAALRVFYGGTFDPVHHGHLAIARAAHVTLGVPVALMPAADPPHRPPPGASAADRVAMLELALAGEPGLALDLRELARPGRSYSVDTLRALRDELGEAAPLALLVGADSFLGLPTWKAWEALLDLAHFVVAERAGSPLEAALAPPLAAAVACASRCTRSRPPNCARASATAGRGATWCPRRSPTTSSRAACTALP